MKELDYEKELQRFLKIHNINFNLKTGRYDKEFHTKLGSMWIKSDKGGYDPIKNEKGYYENVFAGFKLGPEKKEHCMLCGTNLEELRKYNPRRRYIKFCCDNHRVEYNRLKKLRKKLGGQFILWHPNKPNREAPQRKEMHVQYSLDDIRPLTTKGRTKNVTS